MDKSERNFLLAGAVFTAFGLANAWYLHWLPYSAPPVLLVLGLGAYLMLSAKK